MKKLIYNSYKTLQHFLFYRVVRTNSKIILLIDIDNTLADTWPTLNKTWKSESERLSKLNPFQSVISHLFKNYSPKVHQWVFLSSRNYFSHLVTINWLKKNNLPAGWKNVILVQSPMEKIDLINKYVKNKIVYFDDLSYNHENGDMKFYEKEIELININDYVEYHGYAEISKIINNYE
jgi:hypothetical protein